MTIYVKYCGGCNPRFDRAALLAQMESAVPKMEVTHNSQQRADAAVIICGCSAACTSREEAIGTYGTFVVWQDKDLSALYEFLKQVESIKDKR